jgi:hypothetical protein
VRIAHEWVERSASGPPEAPAGPIFPPAGGVADGTEIVFRWRPATDPDGDAIADYHFELSARADMKWPLSMNFAKLVSRTTDVGQARYTLPGPGLLNPDTERSFDELGNCLLGNRRMELSVRLAGRLWLVSGNRYSGRRIF